MKLMLLSNYYNHHQEPICEAFDELTNHNFKFVSTESFSDERQSLGWSSHHEKPFVSQYNEIELLSAINKADCVIWGNAPRDMVEARLKNKKLVFQYAERVFKNGYNYLKWLPRLFTYRRLYGRYKSLYLLAAGAYVSADYAMHGVYYGKAYKWGYFPQTKHYDVSELFKCKKKNKILWCGRFLEWKHPDDALEVARQLRDEGLEFEMDFVGTGPMESLLRERIVLYKLEKNVRILGAMSPNDVRSHMENAGIYLFTSDFGEGWGAVLNESMNSGCAVVANHAIGSVPFLLNHNENGLIYENGMVDGLFRKVKHLLVNPEEQHRLGLNAYHTITDLWNAEVAAARFVNLVRDIEDHGYCDLYEEGPCSYAPTIKNAWFRESKPNNCF